MPWGKLGTIWAEIGLETAALAQGVARSKALMEDADRSLTSRVQAISRSLGSIGTALSIGVTTPLTFMGNMLKNTSMQFETAMANVWTIVDAGKDTIAAMGKEVEALSFELPQTAKQLADGLYQVISASIPAADAMGVLEVSAKAASAGLSDTFTAVDAVTSVLNAYGMAAEEAGRVSDIMFKTVERGKVTFPELAQNLGDVVSTAATAGVSFEELGGALATLTKVGVRAPEAVTALNQAILTFIDPSDEAAKLAKQLGIEFNATSLATKGLYGVLQDVQKATDGNIEMLSALFPNVRALKGVLGLLRQDMGLFRDDLDAMRTSLGATDKAFEKQAQTGAHAMQLFKNQVSALARAFGDELVPMLVSAMQQVQPLIEGFRELPEPVKQTIVQFGLLAAAVGPVMLAIKGLLAAISGPVGIVVGVIAATGAIVGLVRALSDIQGRAERAANAAEAHADSLRDQRTRAQELIEKIQALTREKETLQQKTERTKDEEKQLAEVQADLKKLSNELAAIIPTVATAYDEEGNAVVDLNKALRELVSLRQQEYKERAKAAEAYVVAKRTELDGLRRQLADLEAEAQDKIAGARMAAEREAAAMIAGGMDEAEAHERAMRGPAILEARYNAMLRELRAKIEAAEKELYVLVQRYRAVGQQFETGKEPVEIKTVGGPPGGEVPPPGKEKEKEKPPEPVAWELWLAKVRALSKESYRVLQEAFEDIQKGLESGDIVLRTQAEQRMSAILSFLGKAITEYGAQWEKKIAPALSEFVKRGYKEAEKSATELGKAMEDLRHRVIVEGLKPEEQLAALLGLKGLEGTEEEARRLAEQIAQVTEQVRQQQVQSALDQYRFEARLYDFKAADHVDYLTRILADSRLSAEERKDLEQELALWQKAQREEEAEAARRQEEAEKEGFARVVEAEQQAQEKRKALREAWNEYFVESGRKTRREVLAEAVATAQEELQLALRTGQGIEEADLKLRQAREALRRQEKQDARDEYDFLVQMGALTTAERIDQIRKWLAEEREGSEEWKKLKLEERSLLKQFYREEAEAVVQRLGPIDTASLEQLQAIRVGLGQAYKDAVALGEEGADAASLYREALERVAAAIDKLLGKQAELFESEQKWRYEHREITAEQYLAYLKDQLAGAEEFSSRWLQIQAEIERVTREQLTEQKESADEAVARQIAQAETVAEVNLLAAIDMLQTWREVYAAMGQAGEDAVKKIDAKLVEFVERHKKAAGEVQAYLAQQEEGALATRLKALDEEYRAKAAAGVDLVKLQDWYHGKLKEITDDELSHRVKNIDRMTESEVFAAQKALDEILLLIQERVGQESEAAELIAAIQAALNERLLAIAKERREQEQEEYRKRIDDTIRDLQQEMEFRKTLGELTWRDELIYLEAIANLDAETREARLEGASRYYNAVRSMMQSMTEEELAALEAVLEASLQTYLAMGEAGAEMAAAITAALDAIREKGEETFDALRDRIADTIGNWIEDLVTGAKTFNDILKDIGRSILRFFIDIVAKQIASSIASSVASATKSIQAFGQQAGGILNNVIGLLKGLGPGGWVVAGLATIATLATAFGPKHEAPVYNPVEAYTPGTEEATQRTVTRQAVAPVSVVFTAGAIQIVNPNRIEDIVDQVGKALAKRLEEEDILFGVGPA